MMYVFRFVSLCFIDISVSQPLTLSRTSSTSETLSFWNSTPPGYATPVNYNDQSSLPAVWPCVPFSNQPLILILLAILSSGGHCQLALDQYSHSGFPTACSSTCMRSISYIFLYAKLDLKPPSLSRSLSSPGNSQVPRISGQQVPTRQRVCI